MKKNHSIISAEKSATGNWLFLEKLIYTDNKGKIREWEAAMRKSGCGAVAIIPFMKPSGRIILVRQFRPPAKGYVIEFPAGLIDTGESPEETAVRELKEETGYTGRIVRILPLSFSSPGLSGESVSIIIMEVDETDPVNQNIRQEQDEGEDIEVLLIPEKKLFEFLEKSSAAGDKLDSKLICFAMGERKHCPRAIPH